MFLAFCSDHSHLVCSSSALSFPFYRLQPVSVPRPDPRGDSKCHSLPSVALGLCHSAWLGNWFSVHCVEQSRCSANPALGPGTLLLSAEAHKFLSDNQYWLFLFLTWLPLGNSIISEILELIENLPGQCLGLGSAS